MNEWCSAALPLLFTQAAYFFLTVPVKKTQIPLRFSILVTLAHSPTHAFQASGPQSPKGHTNLFYHPLWLLSIKHSKVSGLNCITPVGFETEIVLSCPHVFLHKFGRKSFPSVSSFPRLFFTIASALQRRMKQQKGTRTCGGGTGWTHKQLFCSSPTQNSPWYEWNTDVCTGLFTAIQYQLVCRDVKQNAGTLELFFFFK